MDIEIELAMSQPDSHAREPIHSVELEWVRIFLAGTRVPPSLDGSGCEQFLGAVDRALGGRLSNLRPHPQCRRRQQLRRRQCLPANQRR